jgi:hypothetical protein
MKPERRIENFLRRIDVVPDAERKRLGLEELLEARGQTQEPTSADARPPIRRLIMNRPIWKVAAALMFAATVIGVIGILQNGDQSAYAFGQTVAAMQGKRSFHIQTYYDSPTKRHDEFWAEFDEHGKVIRVRQLDQWRKENRPVEVLWENQVQHKYTPGLRRPGYRRSGILEISKTTRHVDEHKLEAFDPETMIEEINAAAENGRATVKIDDTRSPDGNHVVEVTSTHDPSRTVLLVDPRTKRVLRMDQYRRDDEGNEKYSYGIDVLEYSRPFDPRLFKPGFPTDTIVINQLSREVGMAQGELSNEDVAREILHRGLKAWAADDYDTSGLIFGGAPKEFFEQRESLKPVGDIDLGEPEFDPIEPGRPRFGITCRYATQHEGRRTTVNRRYWVTTVEGQPGRWYILHYITTAEKGESISVGNGRDVVEGSTADTPESARFLFKDNNLDYQPINTRTRFYNREFELPFLGLAKDGAFLYIKLVYVSPIESWVGVRLAGDAPGLREFLRYGTEIGDNLLIIQLETREVLAYPESICVEIGDDHSVVIDKDTVDDFIADTPKSVRFLFEDNSLNYKPISTRTEFYNKDFKLPFLGLAKDDAFLYIKLEYDSPIKSQVGVRLAGDAPGLWEFMSHGTEIGRNLLIIQLEAKKVLAYPASICVEIGDSHSVVIDKELVDAFITDTTITSEVFSFEDNSRDYQAISTRTKFSNQDFKLPFLGLAKDDTSLFIKLAYVSPIRSGVGVRLAGDKDISEAFGLPEFLPYGTEIGKNLLIIRLEIGMVVTYPTHICVEIGDDHSVTIDKDVVDDFIAGK